MNKAITAFRRYIKSKGEIVWETMEFGYAADDIFEITIRFKLKPKKEGKELDIWLAAKKKAKELL